MGCIGPYTCLPMSNALVKYPSASSYSPLACTCVGRLVGWFAGLGDSRDVATRSKDEIKNERMEECKNEINKQTKINKKKKERNRYV